MVIVRNKIEKYQINKAFKILFIFYVVLQSVAFLLLLLFLSFGIGIFEMISRALFSFTSYSLPLVGFILTLLSLHTYKLLKDTKMILILTLLNIFFALNLANLFFEIFLGQNLGQVTQSLFVN